MISDFTKGIVRENPVFIILLGLCPTLAVSTQVINAIGMGAGVIFVLLGSNLIISLLRDYIPLQVRIPACVVVIATFVTIVDLFMQAYTPELSKNLGIYVQLMVVNCIILGRAEAFARSNGPAASLLDAFGMGIGFALSLLFIALVREVLGAGTITLFPIGAWKGVIEIPGLSASPVRVMTLASGALLLMGYLKALYGVLVGKKAGQA
jgi:Na+-translocating ferredoxin:NAD+ oxidoreductase subunit E